MENLSDSVDYLAVSKGLMDRYEIGEKWLKTPEALDLVIGFLEKAYLQSQDADNRFDFQLTRLINLNRAFYRNFPLYDLDRLAAEGF
jgi:hypothetical protein